MKNKIFGIAWIVMLLLIGTNDAIAQKSELSSKRGDNYEEQKRAQVLESRTQKQLLLWQKRLELSDAQVTELEPVLAQYIISVQALKADDTLDDTQKKAAAAELRKAYDAQFRTHLTAEQQAKFDQLRRSHKQVKTDESRELKAK